MKESFMHIVKEDRKKLGFLAVIAFLAVALLIYGGRGDEVAPPPSETTVATFDGKAVEEDLAAILSRIDGAGDVACAITWDGGVNERYAVNEETSDRRQEGEVIDAERKSEIVLVDGGDTAVVSGWDRPAVDGVLIVAAGAADDGVRERLLTAAATYLAIGADRVEVVAAEK